MSNPYGNPQPCAGTQAQLPTQCACADPGVVASGGNVIVADSNLCPRRLLPMRDSNGNVVNGLIVVTGTGQVAAVFQTNQPEVAYPETALAADQSFGELVIASGVTGKHFRVAPPGAADLFLQTDGAGMVMFGAPPTATVPDPLDIHTLNIDTALNVAGAVAINGTIALTIPTGTIANLLGLDGSNNVVSGSVQLVDKAWFFEAASRTSTSYPNTSLTNGGVPTIGFSLFAGNGNAIVNSGTSIKIVNTGSYQIDWTGAFGVPASAGNQFPGLSLVRNGTIVNPGQRGLFTQVGAGSGTGNSTSTICGSHVAAFNANDVLNLQVVNPTNGSISGTPALNLRDVGVIVTRFK